MCGGGNKDERGSGDDDGTLFPDSEKKDEGSEPEKVEEQEQRATVVSSDPLPPVKDVAPPQGSHISNGEAQEERHNSLQSAIDKPDVPFDDQFGSQRSFNGGHAEQCMPQNQAVAQQDWPPTLPPERLRCIGPNCRGWRVTLLLGCGHLTYCKYCTCQLLHQLPNCPMPGCNAAIKAFLTVLYQ